MISGSTRPFVLLGNPVSHSFSPAMQNAAFSAAGCDGVYFTLSCESADVATLMRVFAEAGGGGNVTIPHKVTAAGALDSASNAVHQTGACNTFWLEDGRLAGDNTDVQAIADVTRAMVGSMNGGRALVLGAGGAARAAVGALLEDGAHVLVLGRSRESLGRLRATFDAATARLRTATQSDEVRDGSFDVVINATPLGMKPADPPPLDLDLPARIGAIVDMVARRDGTPWTRAATERGIPVSGGLEILVAQGAAAFRRWWPGDPSFDAMRSAIGLD